MLIVINVMLGQTQLPSKSKLKIIEYKSAEYIAIGYIENKAFVEGQNITILSKQTKDTIISGKYFTEIEEGYVDGMWIQYNENSIIRAYGLFKVSNSDREVGLTTKKKRAGSLDIEAKDISECYGFYNDLSTFLKKISNEDYSLKVQNTGNNEFYKIAKLEIIVNKSLIEKYGFFAIDDFIFYTTDVLITQKNGNIFNGKVEYSKDESNRVIFTYKEGKWKSIDGEEELILLSDNNYKYRKTYSRDTENNIKEVELFISPLQMEKFGFWATKEYFDSISHVKYTYKNGNIFIGEVNLEKKILSNGIYYYSTGEVFEGNIGGSWFCGIPIEGKMKFNDGSTELDNWLMKYQLTKSEVNELEKINSPTEVRKKAINFFNERSYQNAIKEAQTAVAEKNYDLAKKWYLNAKNFIIDEVVPKDEGNDFLNFLRKSNNPTKTEFVDDEIRKIDKIIEDEVWKKDLISRFGVKYGMSIYHGEFIIGMTQEMVHEIMAKEMFIINKYGHIESWTFDQDYLFRLTAELQRKGKGICNRYGSESEECRLAAERMGHIATTMQRYAERIREFGGPKIPRILTFSNGKLSGIYNE